MKFFKTFLVSLVIYLGLNALFMLAAIFLVPGYPATDWLYLLASVFFPISIAPNNAWISFTPSSAWIPGSGIVGLIIAGDIVPVLMIFLWLIIPPLIAIIVAARIGETNQTGFGAWFTVALLSCGIYAIILGIGQTIPLAGSNLNLDWAALISVYGDLGAILAIFITGVINGFFYGCICLLLANKWI
jgi:hypothetical protein